MSFLLELKFFLRIQVRVEYLQQPEIYIPEVLERVKPEFVQQRYGLPNFDPTCHLLSSESMSGRKPAEVNAAPAIEYPPNAKWPVDANLFLELVAKKTGKLLKVCLLNIYLP